MKSIYILSPCRQVGGSGTEVLHLIDLFRKHEIEVYCVNGFGGDQDALKYCESIGVHSMRWPERDWSFLKDKIVLAHGNPNFHICLPWIKAAKPAKILYISPMWTPSTNELVSINQGLIDEVIHVSNAQRAHHRVIYQQKGIKANVVEGYRPYINVHNTLQNLKYQYKSPKEYCGIGMTARPDPLKFHKDLWQGFRKIESPVAKKYYLNSFNGCVVPKTGPIPSDLEVKTYQPYEIKISEFLSSIHMIFQASGEGESFGRFFLEAIASGVPCVLENTGQNAYSEIAVPGEHFVWANNPELMAVEASKVLSDNHTAFMALAAYNHLLKTWGNEDFCWEFWKDKI